MSGQAQKIHVALASDGRYVPGLFCAVTSLLLHSDRTRPVVLHVMDGGIPDVEWFRLCTQGDRLHPRVSFDRIRLELAAFAGLHAHRTGSLLPYARLLLPSLLAADRVLYLDADLLVARDIAELWDTDLQGCLAAAALDLNVLTLAGDWPWPEDPAIPLGAPYFNSGVMLIDLVGWRREGVPEAALEYVRLAAEKCRYWDQTALNRVLHDRVHMIDGSWNRVAWHADRIGYEDMNCIIHFTAGAPWLRHGYGDWWFLFNHYMKLIGEMHWRSPWFQLQALVSAFGLTLWRLLPAYYKSRAWLCRVRGQERQAELFGQAAVAWCGAARRDYLASRRVTSRNRSQIRQFLSTVAGRLA